MKKRVITCIIFFTTSLLVNAQIGAEAQGGKLSLWAAFGIDQELSQHWISVTDLGYGRHSDPNNTLFLKRQGLNVLTQDFIYSKNKHWQFTLSFGYWRRNSYSDNAPFDEKAAPYQYRNEVRPYQKIYYKHSLKNIKISHTLRTDYRFYYDETFKGRWTTPFEFRARYMQSWKIPLTQNKKNWLITSDEVLSAIDHYSPDQKITGTGKKWSPYQFTENRLSLYYRRSLIEQNIEIDIGLMHQYWRDKPGVNTFNVSYNIMFDIIIKDPFSKKEKKSS